MNIYPLCDVIYRLKSVLQDFPETPDNAPDVHAAAIVHFAKHGYLVEAEVTVKLPGERQGRIDLRLYDTYHRRAAIVVEIDARKPRKKSILKLRQFSAARVILLRGVSAPRTAIDGIDLVYSLPVYVEGDETRASVRATAKAVAQ